MEILPFHTTDVAMPVDFCLLLQPHPHTDWEHQRMEPLKTSQISHFPKHYNPNKIRENGLLSFCRLANEFIYPLSPQRNCSLEMQKWLISHHKARNRYQTFSLHQEKTIVRLKLLISCSSHKGEHPDNSSGYIVRKGAQNFILLPYYRWQSFDKGSEIRKTRKIRK